MVPNNSDLQILTFEGAEWLSALYDCLSHDNPADGREACRRFSVILLALHTLSAEHFSFKPKVHWMIEMLEFALEGAKPSSAWTYRDEEFGGTLKFLARASGGPGNPGAIGTRVLRRFAALEPLEGLQSK